MIPYKFKDAANILYSIDVTRELIEHENGARGPKWTLETAYSELVL